MSSTTPVTPVNSASVMIIRDGDDHSDYGRLEILMGMRNKAIKFAGGAYVFPGGKEDAGDRELEENDPNSKIEELPEVFKGLRYTALREVFEETGLILGALNGQLIDANKQSELAEKYRSQFLNGEINLTDFLQQSSLTLSVADCLPFAHWVTPLEYPKRFDTRFFLCRAPEEQIATPDGNEIIETRWVKPLALIEEAKGTLMFPTMMNLKKLARARTVDQAFEMFRPNDIVTVLPEIVDGEKGKLRVVNADAGYENVDQTHAHPGFEGKKFK